MKKLIAAAALAVLALGFTPGHADRYTDRDCAESEMGVSTWQGTDEEGNADPGRGAVCVNDGTVDDPETEENENNGAELYVGGEVDTESSENFSCGAIVVMGMQGTGLDDGLDHVVFGEPDWDGDDCQ